jgi:xanthine dehydrogenase iron-sulfur cluster and FAD-binding subunit A
LAGNEIDEERLREIVSSNLCRCTGYLPILAAAREVAADRSQDLLVDVTDSVGGSVPKRQ